MSVFLAMFLYLPLTIQIFRGTVKQNFATWVLWGLLDGLASASMFVQDGNWQLPAMYVLGCSVILISILIKDGIFIWTRFETYVGLLVLACIVGWIQSGPRFATIFSSVAMVIASFPQIVDSWKKPHEVPVFVYIGYFVVNLLSAIGGKSWTIEERFYPLMCVFICAIFVGFSLRKYILIREAVS
jgi:hypothetical protein